MDQTESLARLSLPRGGRVTLLMQDTVKPICINFPGAVEIVVEQNSWPDNQTGGSSCHSQCAQTRKDK
jgi:hypothetical protein